MKESFYLNIFYLPKFYKLAVKETSTGDHKLKFEKNETIKRGIRPPATIRTHMWGGYNAAMGLNSRDITLFIPLSIYLSIIKLSREIK